MPQRVGTFSVCYLAPPSSDVGRRMSQREKHFSFAPRRKNNKNAESRPQSPLAQAQKNIISIKPYKHKVCVGHFFVTSLCLIAELS